MRSNLVYTDDVIAMMNKNYINMFTELTDSRATAVEAIGSLIIELAQELAKSEKYYTMDINILMMTIEGYVNSELEEQNNEG